MMHLPEQVQIVSSLIFDDSIQMIPHPKAPLIGQVPPDDLYREAVSIASGEASHWNAEDVAILQQASYGNLFFFLRFIAAYSGPYTQLKPDLHMEMCNWRQAALAPGTWNAGFTPRSTYKSSVWTHGAITWELLRNPNLRVGIFSNIVDRSLQFMHIVQRNFDSNDLIGFLFPEHYVRNPRSRDVNWSAMEATMPNRTRNFPEPSLKAHTAGGSTQGIHVDLGSFDDIVGDSQLNAERKATADMLRLGNWLSSNLRTLLISQATSRVVLAATRYNIEDPYEVIMQDTCIQEGDWSEIAPYYEEATSTGRWNVYYRSALSGAESIFPESYSVEFLQRLAKDDPWTYVTQYVNNVHTQSSMEFSGYGLKTVEVDWTSGENPFIVFPDGRTENLADMYLCLGVDPSATGDTKSRRASKSAFSVVGRTSQDEIVLLEARKDYLKPSQFQEYLFHLTEKYQQFLRLTRVECQGPFKLLEDLIRDEMIRRKRYFPFLACPAMGDKVTTIKFILEPYLKRGAMYVAMEAQKAIQEEFNLFPSSNLDLLDASKIGVAGTRRPDGAYDQGDEDDDDVNDFSRRKVGVAGY